MKQIRDTFEKVLPSNEVLERRAGAVWRDVEVDDGRYEEAPFFDGLDVDEIRVVDERATKFGREVVLVVRTNDSIWRDIRLDLPDETDVDLVVTDGAAWTTDNDGYVRPRAHRVVERTGTPVIRIGAEHSGNQHLPYVDRLLSLPETFLTAQKTSLAKTAQSEELIIDQLTKNYELPRRQYVIGDSRAAMKALRQHIYAKAYGLELAYMDIKAPCVPDKLEVKDIPRFLTWMGTEVGLGSLALLSMIRQGHGGSIVSTLSGEPNFVLGSIVGAMPALAAGAEANQLLPRDARGHVVLYGHDGMSWPEVWKQRFEGHPHILTKHVRGGIHASLLNPASHMLQIGRIERYLEVTDGGRSVNMTADEEAYVWKNQTATSLPLRLVS